MTDRYVPNLKIPNEDIFKLLPYVVEEVGKFEKYVLELGIVPKKTIDQIKGMTQVPYMNLQVEYLFLRGEYIKYDFKRKKEEHERKENASYGKGGNHISKISRQ